MGMRIFTAIIFFLSFGALANDKLHLKLMVAGIVLKPLRKRKLQFMLLPNTLMTLLISPTHTIQKQKCSIKINYL